MKETVAAAPRTPDIGRSMLYAVALHGPLFVVLWAVLAFVVPRFKDLFKDFNYELPALTKVIIRLGDFAREWWFVVPVFLVVVLTVDGLANYFIRRSVGRLGTGVWIGLLIVAQFAMLMLVVIGLFQPLVILMQSVGKNAVQ